MNQGCPKCGKALLPVLGAPELLQCEYCRADFQLVDGRLEEFVAPDLIQPPPIIDSPNANTSLVEPPVISRPDSPSESTTNEPDMDEAGHGERDEDPNQPDLFAPGYQAEIQAEKQSRSLEESDENLPRVKPRLVDDSAKVSKFAGANRDRQASDSQKRNNSTDKKSRRKTILNRESNETIAETDSKTQIDVELPESLEQSSLLPLANTHDSRAPEPEQEQDHFHPEEQTIAIPDATGIVTVSESVTTVDYAGQKIELLNVSHEDRYANRKVRSATVFVFCVGLLVIVGLVLGFLFK